MPTDHLRRSLRLKGFDYSAAGGYFVTICTHNRRALFGEIRDEVMELSTLGKTVELCWEGLPARFPGVTLDTVVVMPNHFHAVVMLPWQLEGERHQNVAATGGCPSLGFVVNHFKATVTRAAKFADPSVLPVWQPDFYDHVIRNEHDLRLIREDIQNNPVQWTLDRENPNY